jgi:nodulation protein E
MRRVAVTGIGVVSALGADRESFWDSIVAGRSGIAPIELDARGQEAAGGAGLKFTNGAQARGFDAGAHFDQKTLDNLDRFAQMGLVAAREAVAHAGLSLDDALKSQAAVVTGSCVGGQGTEDRGYHELYGLKLNRFHPMSIPKSMANAGASLISMDLGLRGPAWTVSTACSSANHAIGQAFWLVRNGGAEVAIAGGSEAPFVWGLLKAWEAMRVVSPDTCRPFSRDRKGLILGEGAAMLVLEPIERARARGAQVFAEIAGFGMSADAHHITMPSPAGAAAAMRAALADAGMRAEEVGYVNAHGTGTQANDPTETEAVRTVLGDRVAVSSTKSMHGHALGAAGALEAAATVLALSRGVLPPTANYTEPDPACDLDVIPNEARRAEVSAALSNSFAFGGLNAVLAFRR